MTNFGKASAILVETREAIKRAEALIERALAPNSHPTAVTEMAASCARLKGKLEEEMIELQKAIDTGGR